MKTNLINSTFVGITILLIAGCASMTQAPSTPPSATVRIREWSAAYYGSAAAGKGTLYYNGRAHHFTISGVGVGGASSESTCAGDPSARNRISGASAIAAASIPNA